MIKMLLVFFVVVMACSCGNDAGREQLKAVNENLVYSNRILRSQTTSLYMELARRKKDWVLEEKVKEWGPKIERIGQLSLSLNKEIDALGGSNQNDQMVNTRLRQLVSVYRKELIALLDGDQDNNLQAIKKITPLYRPAGDADTVWTPISGKPKTCTYTITWPSTCITCP